MNLERLFVLDTNIIVSAVLIKEGKARQALDKAQVTGVVAISTSVLSELEEVLARSKFDKYVSAMVLTACGNVGSSRENNELTGIDGSICPHRYHRC